MTGRTFECSQCGDHAFLTPSGASHHGTPELIDHDADGDHVALDPQEMELIPSGFTSNRATAADAAFEAYDFGAQVLSSNGWEYSSPGNEMTRTVFIESLDGKGPSDRAHFTVRFKDATSADIIEAYAISDQGVVFGKRH